MNGMMNTQNYNENNIQHGPLPGWVPAAVNSESFDSQPIEGIFMGKHNRCTPVTICLLLPSSVCLKSLHHKHSGYYYMRHLPLCMFS